MLTVINYMILRSGFIATGICTYKAVSRGNRLAQKYNMTWRTLTRGQSVKPDEYYKKEERKMFLSFLMSFLCFIGAALLVLLLNQLFL